MRREPEHAWHVAAGRISSRIRMTPPVSSTRPILAAPRAAEIGSEDTATTLTTSADAQQFPQPEREMVRFLENAKTWGDVKIRTNAPWLLARFRETRYFRNLYQADRDELTPSRLLTVAVGLAPRVNFWPQMPIHARSVLPRTLVRLGYRPTLAPPDNTTPSVAWSNDTFVEPHVFRGAASPCINSACRDISKNHLGVLHKEVFGYSAEVDPTIGDGLMVKKNNLNAWHDGVIIRRPTQREPGFVYQCLIDNRCGHDLIEDIRVPYFSGELPYAYIKRRPIAFRFKDAHATVEIAHVRDLFTPTECRFIKTLCSSIALDYGELDILRNREDGKIYVVDVNKTPFGPPAGLPKKDATAAMAIYAVQVEALVNKFRPLQAQGVT